MIGDFFQTQALPLDQLHGTYNHNLVILSVVVAICASYIALDLTGRLRDMSISHRDRYLWLIGGAIAMGCGIWSMHFIGMLSFTIPGLNLQYSIVWTMISLVVAVFVSAFALYLLQAKKAHLKHYAVGGMFLAVGIAAMHYTGMEGMLITLNIRYLPSLFFLSIIVALVASEAALYLALKSNQVVFAMQTRIKLISSVVMGFAIAGMHYIGMAASVFTPLCGPNTLVQGATFDPSYLSVIVAVLTFAILAIAFIASTYKEVQSLQQVEKARQLGMNEIASSVLHNVGNILNSVNVSVSLLTEIIANSKLASLTDLAALFEENKGDISGFLQTPKGLKSITYLTILSQYWQSEQTKVAEELDYLNKNVNLIKETIAIQQKMAKVTEMKQIVDLNEVLEEAVIIAGFSSHPLIHVERQLAANKTLSTDKIKLIQVIVNLLLNAKQALFESTNAEKILTLKTYIKEDKVYLEISDNGIGILPKNLVKVFHHGFTTKKDGHGFGLHSSALAIRALGGELQLTSEGLNAGVKVVIDLPLSNLFN